MDQTGYNTKENRIVKTNSKRVNIKIYQRFHRVLALDYPSLTTTRGKLKTRKCVLLEKYTNENVYRKIKEPLASG